MNKTSLEKSHWIASFRPILRPCKRGSNPVLTVVHEAPGSEVMMMTGGGERKSTHLGRHYALTQTGTLSALLCLMAE